MIIVIVGPTCSAKSETAYKLAPLINAEIVNGDAFQCYKELDIGVAKPPKEYLEKISHHLYSFVSPSEEYSIATYQKNLRSTIDEILSRNKSVIIVGGSGLYIRSALYDYSFNEESSKVDMSKYEKMSNEELHKILESIDSEDAKKIHPNNRKRVLRSIEIYLSSGENKSSIISKQEHKPIYDVKFFTRDIAREVLNERINTRVDKMMKDGLFDEVKKLYNKYPKSSQALQAIGYKELIEVIDGKLSLDEGIELIKKNTRNYAKRQMTFIRHQFDVIFYKDDNSLMEIIKNG